MTQLNAIDLRFLGDIDDGLLGIAPLAKRVQVQLAIAAAVDERDAVIAAPFVARPDRPAATAVRVAAPAEAQQHAQAHARRRLGVVG